ncbi:MAG: hypothetical protein PHT13_03095, partial [Methanosarcina sp.]|nr:hypothetical protein [Methanosarcina sp.]
EVEPENTEAWIKKGTALGALKRYEEALKAFWKAIEIEPENADSWVGKSIVFSSLELYGRALETNAKALVFEPKNKNALINKAVVFQKLKKYIEHRESLEDAFNIDPNDPVINNYLAEYYLTFGDLKNASKYVENSLLVDKKDPFSLGLKGKIKIEEQDYDKSSACFKKAISSDIMNPSYLLWNSYAKYLKAELEFAGDEKKYQDMILAIIRELEKVDTCGSQINKNNIKVIPHWFIKVVPHWFINFVIFTIKLAKRTLIYLNRSEKWTVKMLAGMNLLLSNLESPKIIAYNYYFLGCFYYKINDYFTAVEYLKKCKNLKSDSHVKKSAHDTLDNIWNNKVRPSIWDWWLYSPINRLTRRFAFVALIFSLFGILLPSVVNKIIDFALIQFSNISAYKPLSYFPIIEPAMSTINRYFDSFFSSINWQENTISPTFLVLIIIFILGSPIIQHFKGSQIEIEIRPPPAFEFIPSLIERKLKDLEFSTPTSSFRTHSKSD